MHLPEQLSVHSRSDVARRLFDDAQRLADSLSVWRVVDTSSVAALVMIYKMLATHDARSNEAMMYLAAACQQLRLLGSQDPNLVTGFPVPGTSPLSWCTALLDTLSSAERKTTPHL